MIRHIHSGLMTLLSALLVALLFATAAQSASNNVQIELNRLESTDKACRAYLVTHNRTDTHFKKLKLDVVMFNSEGIIAKRLGIGLAPLAPDQTSVKVFDIAQTDCDDLGQFLMNGVLACRDDDGALDDCASKLTVSSRDAVSFID